MGTKLPLLLLVLAAVALPSPRLEPAAGAWLSSQFSLSCHGAGSRFLLLRRGSPDPVADVMASSGGGAYFSCCGVAYFNCCSKGTYTCQSREGNVTSPPSNAVEVAATDPQLPPPPPLSVTVTEPEGGAPGGPGVPEGSHVSFTCRDPRNATAAANVTFRLFRGGPGGAVGQPEQAPGGAARASPWTPCARPTPAPTSAPTSPRAPPPPPPPAPPGTSMWQSRIAPTPTAPTGRAAGPGLRPRERPPRTPGPPRRAPGLTPLRVPPQTPGPTLASAQ
ncbi:proline-rich protein 2-like isoform X2 [Struthio camelus]|uniref:proline-rich protein 2-like isoform X2 n=1 Tax=Struthio camelus TaxID=8801 RepID=UPI003603D5ED